MRGVSNQGVMISRTLIFGLALLLLLQSGRAELPPSVYEKMQADAPEKISMQVLRVEVEIGDSAVDQKVTVMSVIEKVDRTAGGLKPGEFLTIVYTVTERPPGWVGPGPVPFLSEQEQVTAYLRKVPDSEFYEPAAGAMSFSEF